MAKGVIGNIETVKVVRVDSYFQIVENIQDQKIRTGYYGEIANHYSSKGDFEVSDASSVSLAKMLNF